MARAHWLLTGKTLLAGMALVGHGHFALAQQTSAGVPVEKPVPGFLSVNIAGHRTLRYRCAGRGTPTVLVEQGMAISVETTFSWKEPVGWAAIFPQISRVTRICVYDRAGLGRSSKLTSPATSLDA